MRARHPDVTLDALVSIYSQESSRKIRANHGRHVRAIESHAKRYLLGEDVTARVPTSTFPSCQLMRLCCWNICSASGTRAWGRCCESRSREFRRDRRSGLRERRTGSDCARGCDWTSVPRGGVGPPSDRAMRGGRAAPRRGKRVRRFARGIIDRGRDTVRHRARSQGGGARENAGRQTRPPIAAARPQALGTGSIQAASFSDPLVHVEKGNEQFQGYVNRFGPGDGDLLARNRG